MKAKLVLMLAAAAVLVGSCYAVRLLPLVTTDNAGNERVVLLHGLGRTQAAMLLMESELTAAGYDVTSVGYSSIDEPPEAILPRVAEEMSACCVDADETVHYVGHSLGGLLIRAYLAENRPRNLGRVVLLGTPNKGSEVADIDTDEGLEGQLLEWAGPTARALTTRPDGFPASLPTPDYSVGIIAGTRDRKLTNRWLPVPNDGLVSVESAKLDGMTDFITLDLAHWDLRNDKESARQVIAFLETGRFSTESAD